jgi:hypothetical protein
MNTLTAIKDEASWNGIVAAEPAGQASLAEIADLLREIRDLQRAHFERYKEFTGRIMDSEKTRHEEAARLQYQQLHYQADQQRLAFQRQLISWAVWGGVCVLGLVAMFAFQLLSVFE